jgi:hypothetical protein
MRAAVVLAGVSTIVLLGAPAFAAVREASAEDPGPGLTVPETLGIFVGIPALIIGVIWVLVYSLTGRKAGRYRPGVAWRAEPQWWGGPDNPEQALASAVPTTDGGGARAHW